MSIEAKVQELIASFEAMSIEELEREFAEVGYVPVRKNPKKCYEVNHIISVSEKQVTVKSKIVNCVSCTTAFLMVDNTSNDFQSDDFEDRFAA